MIEKLEEIKQLGNYAIDVRYGEDAGCDDLDVPIAERKIIVIMSPIGYVGELRCLYNGIYKDFLRQDFSAMPTVVDNPPNPEQITHKGFYVWGTEEAIKILREKKEKEEVSNGK